MLDFKRKSMRYSYLYFMLAGKLAHEENLHV